jgi:drug/metabolite transporter (DMT)-like permease
VTTATVALEASRRQRRGQIYVALAAVAWSSAGVLQRQLTLDTSTQVFGRAAFAGAALLVYVAIVERGRVVHAFRSVGLAGVAVAVCVAIASAGFIAALNHTSVARVLFILAVSPVLAALLARVTLGEPITRRTALAMALALAGVAVMLGAPGEGNLAGDALSFLVALAFALMIVITRWRHDVSMAPATCLSQVILVAVFLPFAAPGGIGGDDVVWLAALGIGQIGLGFALLTVGARLIPAAQVGLITLLEVVLGPVWVSRARRAPRHAHARRRRHRDRRDPHSDARGAAPRAARGAGAPGTALGKAAPRAAH